MYFKLQLFSSIKFMVFIFPPVVMKAKQNARTLQTHLCRKNRSRSNYIESSVKNPVLFIACHYAHTSCTFLRNINERFFISPKISLVFSHTNIFCMTTVNVKIWTQNEEITSMLKDVFARWP